MVGIGDYWLAIDSHARAVANDEVAIGHGRNGYGERERGKERK